MGIYADNLEDIRAHRKLRMEKLNPTPEEVELFERLWHDYSTNYKQGVAWTAPEVKDNQPLRYRFWEWANLAKIGPENDWSREQDKLEYAQEQEALRKAAEQAQQSSPI